jgi:hypothetical protein
MYPLLGTRFITCRRLCFRCTGFAAEAAIEANGMAETASEEDGDEEVGGEWIN